MSEFGSKFDRELDAWITREPPDGDVIEDAKCVMCNVDLTQEECEAMMDAWRMSETLEDVLARAVCRKCSGNDDD